MGLHSRDSVNGAAVNVNRTEPCLDDLGNMKYQTEEFDVYFLGNREPLQVLEQGRVSIRAAL